jgi:hypothetical protein
MMKSGLDWKNACGELLGRGKGERWQFSMFFSFERKL